MEEEDEEEEDEEEKEEDKENGEEESPLNKEDEDKERKKKLHEENEEEDEEEEDEEEEDEEEDEGEMMDSVQTGESAYSPGAINRDNELTSSCPGCKTPWQKKGHIRSACDAMLCTKDDCSHSFCFFCGEDIPYEQYGRQRPQHGRHFGKRPLAWSRSLIKVDWGWCCLRPGVQPWGSGGKAGVAEWLARQSQRR